MTWIATIDYEHAEGALRKIYERVKGPGSHIDNILMAHSLRPHTLEGHMALYKSVLHHPRNRLPKWLLESVGVYVSLLNGCDYCVSHHYEGLRKLLQDDGRAQRMRKALEVRRPAEAFDAREVAALEYAATLALEPTSVTQAMLDDMRAQGLDDGEILEINQVCSYFCYANRFVLGLGIEQEDEMLGLSPASADTGEWRHD